ncbi:MAG: zinc ribbon domain-containing protein [Kiritimatiellaeota bacterium]|nr:zinc ribbon domain-containing protein [Kiritimatiellota bacterium]
MPLYEFYCEPCHTIFTFRAMRVDTKARPPCPVCNAPLKREISTFAHIIRGSSATPPADGDGTPQSPDETAAQRMDEIMARMGDRIQALDDDDADPCEAVKVMREMAEAGGLRFDKDVREAMARIEAGEDPEKIDEQFAEVFDRENPFTDTPENTRATLTTRTLRYLRPPRRDPNWHDF